MKKVLLLIVLMISLSFYAQKGNEQINDGSQIDPKTEVSKKEKKKIKREKRLEAQDSLYVTYYPRKDSLSKYPPYNLKEDGYLIFEIKDINLLRYSVSLNEFQNDIISSTRLNNESSGSQIDVNPDVFSFNSELEVLQPLRLNNNGKKNDLKDLKKYGIKIEKTKTEIKFLKDHINEIQENINNIDERIEIKDSLLKGLKLMKDNALEERVNIIKIALQEIDKEINYKKYDSLKEEIYLEKTRLKDTLNEFLNKKDDYKREEEKVYKEESKIEYYNKLLNSYFEALRDLNKLNNLHQRLLNILSSDKSWRDIYILRTRLIEDLIKENTTKVDVSQEEIEGFSSDDLLIYCQSKLDTINVRFHELSEAYSQLGDIASKKNEIVKHYTEVSTVYKQIPKNSYRLFFAQMIKTFEAINKSNFNLKYRTLVVSDNADVIKYSLKGIPHSNLPFSVETKEITLNYDVRIKGGVKIDVSTGIFWNIGLIDRTFRFEDVDSDPSADPMTNAEDKVRVIRETNDNLFVPSFGVLFHLYRRSYSSTKLGFNIGASTNGDRVNYYLGGSLLVGKSQRINFNFGIAGAQVTEATDMFDTEEPITAPGDLTTVPIQRPFRLGLYAGVTFNLIGNSNKQALDQVRSQITKL